MIVVEEKLALVFNQLPEIVGFKPQYNSGDEYHLNQYLKLMGRDNKSAYPLIYQTSTVENQNEARSEVETTLVLILATRVEKTELLNGQRFATSYRNILNPLAENVISCFKRAGIFLWNETYKIEKFPNYGNGKENETTDIWDAIRFTATITIQGDRCIKTIKF